MSDATHEQLNEKVVPPGPTLPEESPPFVLVTRVANEIRLQSNLRDTTLILGLLTEGMFAAKQPSSLIKPNGMAGLMKRMGG